MRRTSRLWMPRIKQDALHPRLNTNIARPWDTLGGIGTAGRCTAVSLGTARSYRICGQPLVQMGDLVSPLLMGV
jgi:hypothetical protein